MTARNSMSIVFCLLLLSCGEKKTQPVSESIPQSDNSEPQFLPPPFTFIENLVSDTFIISDLAVRIPSGWTSVSPMMLSQMQIGAANDTGQFRHRPEAAYSAEPSGRMLISLIPLGKPSQEEFVWWARDLALVMRNVRTDATIQESWMTLNGIHAMLLIATDKTMLQYKLVLETQPPTSIDYSFPIVSAASQEPKIKSSIASIKKIAAAG